VSIFLSFYLLKNRLTIFSFVDISFLFLPLSYSRRGPALFSFVSFLPRTPLFSRLEPLSPMFVYRPPWITPPLPLPRAVPRSKWLPPRGLSQEALFFKNLSAKATGGFFCDGIGASFSRFHLKTLDRDPRFRRSFRFGW